ncbi:MAG: pyridoxal phosphate-dependent aminotransferase [Hyphomicrobiales bacterium]|nr:pyridoxal phosphate-dependent aminotransferase [Hyphomicrobiales bacterium]MDE2114368.1 pyridoxal phosphate-dependent aminotransferase [Hyphomicrobiales bacterium]
METPDFVRSIRTEAVHAPSSGIVEVFNYGRGRQGLIPLWVGEGDMPTPTFIREAATRSLAAGETFYTHQLGLPELRSAIAEYMTRHYQSPFAGSTVPFDANRFFVTTGGMHALHIAVRMVAGVGDEVLVPTPAWPNFVGALSVCGALPVEVPLQMGGTGDNLAWHLDPGMLAAAITPRTRAIIINTPSNPTGWTGSLEELSAVLELARAHDLWIIADEIYGRIVYDGGRAPSFHDLIGPNDKVMFVQTFSKNWAMTGLRCGWLEAPPDLAPIIENLVQYSTSGNSVPIQRAAIAAITRGEDFVAHQIARFAKSRTILCEGLRKTGKVRFATPPGAFYLFARFDGADDTRALAIKMVDEANVGVAPGTAFGAGGAPYVRICFAPKPDDMQQAVERISAWLARL